MTPYEQMLHDSGKEELSFYRKKSLSEPSRERQLCPITSGWGGRRQDRRNSVEESHRLTNTICYVQHLVTVGRKNHLLTGRMLLKGG